jgi:hypothetical protein
MSNALIVRHVIVHIYFFATPVDGDESMSCGWLELIDIIEYPHNNDGTHSHMKRYSCPAHRSIWVPEDPTLRWAVIVPNFEIPHNQPMLPLTKPSYEARRLYANAVNAHGVVTSTVQSVENGELFS